jgi:hypothetical protein
MRPAFVVFALAVVAASCGGGGEDPASLATCEDVADAAVAAVQESIDVIDSVAAGAEPDPDVATAVEERARVLERRAGELGCTEAEMARLTAKRIGLLRAETVAGQLIIEGLRAETAGGSGGGEG